MVRPRARAASRSRARERLLREAQALAKLSHPNVVAIHDVGVIDGAREIAGEEPLLFVAMEFVEGQTLRRWLQAGRRTLDEIVDKFVQAAAGLAAAHEAGVVHRDFKPDNAIVGRDGRVQVLDFGLARLHQPSTDPEELVAAVPGRDPPPLTVPPARIGTPGYMAPEQHRGESAGPAADQFAFCICLYEALYRKPPFAGDDPTMLAENVMAGRLAEAPRHTKVPLPLRRIVLQGLAVDPADRHPSMQRLIDELRPRQNVGRKRVLAVSAAAVLASGAAWVYATSRSATDDPCPAADARLQSVWDDETRAAVERAFQASGRRHAAATSPRLASSLDGYVEAWLAAHRDACEATHVRREQSDALLDLRMTCLTERLDALAALTSVLRDADGAVVDRALEAVDALPSVAECEDIERVQQRDPLPSDPVLRERVEEQLSAIAQAEAMSTAGRSADANDLASRVVEQARALDHPSLLAHALLVRGHALTDSGQAAAAVGLLREAATVAEAAGHDSLSARSRIALVGAVGDRLSKLEEGHLWADLARASLQRQGGDAVQEAQLEHSLALLADQETKPEDVLVHERKAIELHRSVPGASQITLAAYLNHLAITLGHVGRWQEALATAAEAKALWERSLGPDHPRAALSESTVGLIYDYKGDYRQALSHYEAAHALAVRAQGETSELADEIQNNLAITAANLGDMDRALRAFADILAQRTIAHGSNSASVAMALNNLAAAENMAGKVEEALAHHERALAIREKVFGPDHPQLSGSLNGIANVYEQRGEAERALPLRRRAAAIEGRVYGEDHPDIVLSVANMAHNEMLVGELDAAQASAERALRIAEHNEVTADDRAFTRLVLARVLVERDRDHDRARRLVDEAKQELGDLPAEASRKLVAQVEAALAQK